MSVSGAWQENNTRLMFALLAIRPCGWWDEFWRSLDQRGPKAWQDRQTGKTEALYRNTRGSNAAQPVA